MIRLVWTDGDLGVIAKELECLVERVAGPLGAGADYYLAQDSINSGLRVRWDRAPSTERELGTPVRAARVPPSIRSARPAGSPLGSCRIGAGSSSQTAAWRPP